MKHIIDVDQVKTYVQSLNQNTKIYFGVDSERYFKNDKAMVDYMLVVAVHINGNNGGKVFGEVHTEIDYDFHINKPKLRLMNEIYKISELFQKFQGWIEQYTFEIHIDINHDQKYKSNAVLQEAIGYIQGTCGVKPKIKPEGWCATACADRLKLLLNNKKQNLILMKRSTQ